MRIGYTMSIEDVPLLEEAKVDYIVLTDDKNDPLLTFKMFLDANQDNDIVLVGIHSIGLDIALIQLYDIFNRIITDDYSVTFLDKGIDLEMTNQEYLTLIWHLMSNEKRAVKSRTRKGIAKAKERGIIAGRPPVNQKVIDEIYHLHTNEKRTIREIAVIVGVSIGTVHKYLQKLTASL